VRAAGHVRHLLLNELELADLLAEGVALLNAIQDVYLDEGVTVA